MDLEHEIPKKLVVLATHGDGEPPKTLDAGYVKNIKHYFDNPDKSLFNLIMGYTLDQREYFRDYRLSQKGKLLWDQISMLKWYAWNLCLRYDYTCCSRMKAKHLPFSCEFNDNETLASYANGIYDYYDVEQIEEFVDFMGACEIKCLFEEYENYDDAVYRSENLDILKYCYENYKYNANINAFIEKVSAVQEETNILQESMEEEIAKIVSSLDEKDDEESEEQKEEEQISYPCPPSNESNSSTHTLFNFPSCLPKDDCYDDCYDPVDSLEISLFDDACYACGEDANMNYAYGDELAIVPYVKHEIVAIAPTHDSPIIFLNSPNYTISEKFALIKDYIDGLPFTITHDDFDRYNMHVLAAPTCNYYERGTTSPPPYVSNTIKLQETAYTMHWPLLCVHGLFFYDMPMHKKRVRLRCYMI